MSDQEVLNRIRQVLIQVGGNVSLIEKFLHYLTDTKQLWCLSRLVDVRVGKIKSVAVLREYRTFCSILAWTTTHNKKGE